MFLVAVLGVGLCPVHRNSIILWGKRREEAPRRATRRTVEEAGGGNAEGWPVVREVGNLSPEQQTVMGEARGCSSPP